MWYVLGVDVFDSSIFVILCSRASPTPPPELASPGLGNRLFKRPLFFFLLVFGGNLCPALLFWSFFSSYPFCFLGSSSSSYLVFLAWWFFLMPFMLDCRCTIGPFVMASAFGIG